MPVLSLACHLPHNTPNIPSRYNNEQTTKQTKAINNSYIYISHVNVTQTVPDISPLMPMHQDPLLVGTCVCNVAWLPDHCNAFQGTIKCWWQEGHYQWCPPLGSSCCHTLKLFQNQMLFTAILRYQTQINHVSNMNSRHSRLAHQVSLCPQMTSIWLQLFKKSISQNFQLPQWRHLGSHNVEQRWECKGMPTRVSHHCPYMVQHSSYWITMGDTNLGLNIFIGNNLKKNWEI